MTTQKQVLVDFTTARLNSKSFRGRKIERCPVCGQKGEHTRYTRGGEMYVHRVSQGMWAATVLSGDSCIVGIIG